MGFLRKVGKAISKPVSSAVKSVVKNAVPIAAAVATGGTSLAYIKPQGGLFDKAYGLAGLGTPQASIEEAATQYVQEKATNEINRFATKQLTPKIKAAPNYSPSRRINSQSVSNNVPFMQNISESAGNAFNSVNNAVGGKNNTMMIVGAMVSIVLLVLFLKKGGK